MDFHTLERNFHISKDVGFTNKDGKRIPLMFFLFHGVLLVSILYDLKVGDGKRVLGLEFHRRNELFF